MLSYGHVEASLATVLLSLPFCFLRLSLPVQRAAFGARLSHLLALHSAFYDLLLSSLRITRNSSAGCPGVTIAGRCIWFYDLNHESIIRI